MRYRNILNISNKSFKVVSLEILISNPFKIKDFKVFGNENHLRFPIEIFKNLILLSFLKGEKCLDPKDIFLDYLPWLKTNDIIKWKYQICNIK